MIALEVDNVELEKRLLSRGKDSGRPDDANVDIIRKRIEEYNSKTAPVANFYKSQGKYSSINGIGSIDEIFSSISTQIDSF
jgi:adenylate kinase